jgi:hypothetical protein
VEGGAEAATVVLGRVRTAVVDLALGALDTPTHQVSRQRCDARETAAVAEMLMARLAATGTPGTR